MVCQPLPTTQLDPNETTLPEPPSDFANPSGLFDWPPALRFRHTFWQRRRVATARALIAADVPESRRERFSSCGATAWILQDPADPGSYRIASNRCHDRFCEACAVERRRLVGRNLRSALHERFPNTWRRENVPVLRFVTLTLRAIDAPLTDQLDRLFDGWRRLRRRPAVKAAISGGLTCLEITRNDHTGFWHPHLHIIAAGSYLSKDYISHQWQQITGDSFIIDIRALHSPEAAASYVLKYAAKALSPRVWTDPAAFAEAIRALRARRTFNVFGDWSDFKLSEPPPDDTQWIAVGSFDQIWQKAAAGDLAAQYILNQLRRSTYHEPIDLQPQHHPP